MNLIGLILGFAIQSPAPATVPVLGYCDASAPVIAQAPRDAAMTVRFAIAGTPTCYLATITVDGRELRGYVLDRHLDAVVAFERSRVATEQAAFKAPLYIPPPEAPAAAAGTAAAPKIAAAPKKKVAPRSDVSM